MPQEAPRLTKTPPSNAPLWAAAPFGTDLPAELPPAAPVTADRFRWRIDEIQYGDNDGLSEAGARLLTHLEEYAPQGAERADLVEQALLVEAAHASIADLARAIARGVDRLPTSNGDLIVLHTRLLSPAPNPDVVNRRVGARDSLNRHDGALTPPVLDEDDSPAGERRLTFRDESHFADLNVDQREALGFIGAQIRGDRNRYDLENVARQGVHKEILVSPTRVVARDSGRSGLVLMTANGARRSSMCQWTLEKLLPGVPIRDHPIRHLIDSNGNLTFRRLTSEDADEGRAVLADAIRPHSGPGLSGNSSADADKVAKWAKSLTPASEVLIRTLTEPAMVIIGVDRSTVPSWVKDPLTGCIEAYMSSLHVPQQSDLEWSDKAIQLHVARTILRRAIPNNFVPLDGWAEGLLFEADRFGWASGGLASTVTRSVAGSVQGADSAAFSTTSTTGDLSVVPLTDVPDLTPAVSSGTPRVISKLDVLLAATAAIVCRATAFTSVVAAEIAAKGMPYSPKQRGQLMAAVCLGLVGLPLEGTDAARVHAALSRTPTHSAVYQLANMVDPLGENITWVDLIGADWLEVAARADREANAIADTPGASLDRAGPAQILLALAAAYALIVSPILIHDSEHQLTLSGLGRHHGPSAAEPFTVVLPLVRERIGRRQLLEAIVALCNDARPYVPRSVKFDAEKEKQYPHHFGMYLTEWDLRGRTWGHEQPTDDEGQPTPEPALGAAQFNERLFADAELSLLRFAREFQQLADPTRHGVADPNLNTEADAYGACTTDAFFGDGIDLDVACRLQQAQTILSEVIATGKAVRMLAGRTVAGE